MKKNVLVLVLLSLCISITACSMNPEISSYTVGFATPSGNQIWVKRVIFDDKWTTPVGTMACCWEEAGAGSYIQRRKLPKKVEVEWIDESEKIVYLANVSLPPDLAQRASKLPDFVWKRDGKHDRDIYIIIGMKEQGEVVVWLSNAPHGENMTGRVLEIIGQAQAKGIPWIPPNDQDLKQVTPDKTT